MRPFLFDLNISMLIDAMMVSEELDLLRQTVSRLKPGSTILEIGTAQGGSASNMSIANPAVQIYTLDLFEDWGTDTQSVQSLYQKIKTELEPFENVTVLCGNAMSDFADWNIQLDLYLEDGAHQDPALATNLSRWTQFIKPQGLLMMHDHRPDFPDVIAHVKRLVDSTQFELLEIRGSLALLRKM